MRNWLEIQFWRVGKWLLRKGYGYCDERDGGKFGEASRCGACNASDIQDWIDDHISLIKS